MTGSFLWSRHFSKTVTLQIEAVKLGLNAEYYTEGQAIKSCCTGKIFVNVVAIELHEFPQAHIDMKRATRLKDRHTTVHSLFLL